MNIFKKKPKVYIDLDEKIENLEDRAERLRKASVQQATDYLALCGEIGLLKQRIDELRKEKK
jgi:phage shock protein A